MNQVVVQGRNNPIELENLPLPHDLHVDSSHSAFEAGWGEAKQNATDEKPLSLRRVLWRTFGSQLMAAGIFKVIWSVCVIM
jgi:ATP-binding cassette, subfamily C (CFTR/MRP), member 1